MVLTSSPIGSFVSIDGYDSRYREPYQALAYLPDPLPEALHLDTSSWMAVTEATQALGHLDGAATLLANPQLVTRTATRREAVGTSALEGTFANLREVFAAEAAAEEPGGRTPQVQEVLRYTRAADLAVEWIRERPVTKSFLTDVQALIIGTGRGGELRSTQVFVGSPHSRLADARFIPPPPGDQLTALVDQWLQWLTSSQARTNIPLVARLALAHYQFETIHPFPDGNGRLGRLVIVLQLLREGALRTPALSVSSWLKDRGDEYRDHLLDVSRTGDFGPWIEFLAAAIRAEAEASLVRIRRLLTLQDQIIERVRGFAPRGRLVLDIAQGLTAFPMLTVADARARHGRSDQANRNAVAELVAHGVLEPYDDARYDRVYWCREVFRAVETDPSETWIPSL